MHSQTYQHPDPEARRAYKTAKQREYNNTNRAAKVAAQIAAGVKLCPGCQIVKPFGQFEPNPKKAVGISSHCRECKNEARKARYSKNSEIDRYRRRYRGAREAAIRIYGGQCEGCGDVRNLEFDHVNGDGGEHRKIEGSTAMLRRIAAAGQRITDYELRLLCSECHDFVTNGISPDRLAPAAGPRPRLAQPGRPGHPAGPAWRPGAGRGRDWGGLALAMLRAGPQPGL
jgi:hypothetical protein